jgi:hypothetical protein
MFNQLQCALLEHGFVVQYKKGTNMPADFLSGLPSLPVNSIDKNNIVIAFDPFQPELPQLRVQDPYLQAIFQFLKHGNYQVHLSKHKI